MNKIYEAYKTAAQNSRFKDPGTDNKKGVLKAMKDMIDPKDLAPMIKNAKFTADPKHVGVWKVKAGKITTIVYLKNYEDSWGKLRKMDDFESDAL